MEKIKRAIEFYENIEKGALKNWTANIRKIYKKTRFTRGNNSFSANTRTADPEYRPCRYHRS